MTARTARASGAAEYSAKHIQTQHGLDGLRGSPAMYVGSTDANGLFTTCREPWDNVLDEFLAGRASVCRIKFDADGTVWVQDDGAGIPQGVKEVTLTVSGKEVVSKLPTMQAIFGELHTSGKYHSEAYKVAVGTHGVGVKATNALSSRFEVWTSRGDGIVWYIGFAKGKLVKPVAKAKWPAGLPFKPNARGTILRFTPDTSIFKVKSFPPSLLESWASMMAYMNPGFRIEAINPKGAVKTWFSERGPLDYIDHRNAELQVQPLIENSNLFEFRGELADVIVDFTSYQGYDLKGFTLGLANPEGGVHVDTVYRALYKAIVPFKKKRGPDFNQRDFRIGMVGLVNAKLHKAQYSGQNKAKLTDSRIDAVFEEAVVNAATDFYNANKALATALVERASNYASLKSKFKASASVVKRLNQIRTNGMPMKYVGPDPKTKPADRELLLVEGDSASGTCKMAKFPHQAILPLRGKIQNALNDPKDKAVESEEVINIFGAIGFDPKAADPIAKLNVGKIILLADPDPDGPFVGSTQIDIRRNAGTTADPHWLYQTWSIEKLAQDTKDFQIETVRPLSRGGVGRYWVNATASAVTVTQKTIQLTIGKHKYEVDPDHKWPVVTYKPHDVSEGHVVVDPNTKFGYKRSKDLKAGDVILDVLSKEIDKAAKLPFTRVSRVKHINHDTPQTLFCLTVPDTHNFVLPSGIVSSNCHIEALLLSLIYRYLPDAIERGMVYVLQTREFYSLYQDRLVLGDSVAEVRQRLDGLGASSKHIIKHIKGWGEIPANILRIMAMDASTRKLIRIQPGDDSDKMEALMGKDNTRRRQLVGIDTE